LNSRGFYDWQTLGGGNDVERLVAVLQSEQVKWCMIGGLAVNHWSLEPMATADVDIVIATPDVDRAIAAPISVGFQAETFAWLVNLCGKSKVSIQVSTDVMYADFTESSIMVNVHGIEMRVASLANTLAGKIAAWRNLQRRPSERQKDFLDIMRLTEAHPVLVGTLPADIETELAARNAS